MRPEEMTAPELLAAIREAREKLVARRAEVGPRTAIPAVYERTLVALEEERARRRRARETVEVPE